jgi:hypothetical protein
MEPRRLRNAAVCETATKENLSYAETQQTFSMSHKDVPAAAVEIPQHMMREKGKSETLLLSRVVSSFEAFRSCIP